MGGFVRCFLSCFDFFVVVGGAGCFLVSINAGALAFILGTALLRLRLTKGKRGGDSRLSRAGKCDERQEQMSRYEQPDFPEFGRETLGSSAFFPRRLVAINQNLGLPSPMILHLLENSCLKYIRERDARLRMSLRCRSKANTIHKNAGTTSTRGRRVGANQDGPPPTSPSRRVTTASGRTGLPQTCPAASGSSTRNA